VIVTGSHYHLSFDRAWLSNAGVVHGAMLLVDIKKAVVIGGIYTGCSQVLAQLFKSVKWTGASLEEWLNARSFYMQFGFTALKAALSTVAEKQ
jgi:hypothetical protein